jgi:SAM-dependent methyltransferase
MNRKWLNKMICPGKGCGGSLDLASDDPELPVQLAAGAPSEVEEGIVVCARCAARFPVIAGVLVLVAGAASYFRSRYLPIMAYLASLGASTRFASAYLVQEGIPFIEAASDEYSYDSPVHLGKYVSAHYDRLAEVAALNEGPFVRWMQERYVNIYDLLVDKLLPHLSSDGVALDLGSNVGGMSNRLAPYCNSVFGIDFAFASTMTARRILLRQPSPLTEYTLLEEGRLLRTRRLDVAPRSNVEFTVATATELPFEQGTFDLLICVNVIDCVSDAKELLVTMTRALKSGGLLVMSNPYAWHTDGGSTRIDSWLGEPGKQGAAQDLRDRLSGHYDLLWEEDNIPWVLREYSRSYTVWLNHCVIARKR